MGKEISEVQRSRETQRWRKHDGEQRATAAINRDWRSVGICYTSCAWKLEKILAYFFFLQMHTVSTFRVSDIFKRVAT
ncbi:hypothetical protein HN873_031291 [Arachis hypogaea]